MKNLAYCVSMVQLDRQDFSPKNYQRYLQFAINTYKDYIGMGITPSVEVLYADIDSMGHVDMPYDYEYYTKVALLINGTYYTLTRNDNMPLNNRTDTCGDELEDSLVTASTLTQFDYGYGYAFAGHYRAGNFVGELYGMGGGLNAGGYFTLDLKNRRFQFSDVPLTSVVIEYVSNNASQGSLIDDLAVSVIRYGVHDQLNLFDSVNQSEKSRFEGRFKQALLDYSVSTTTPTVDDYLDSRYKTFKSSPKR